VHLSVLIIYCVWYYLNNTRKKTCLSVHVSSLKITVYWHLRGRYRSFATTVSQLKIADFSGETFKGIEVLYSSMSAKRHNCSTADSFANCVMTLYLLKVHLQKFLSIPLTQKCQILICDTLVANERYVSSFRTNISAPKMKAALSTETLVCMISHIRRL